MKRLFTDSRAIRTILILILLGLSYWAITLPKPPLLEDIDFSTAVYDQHHQLLRLTLTSDQQYRLFIPLTDLSPALIQATLLKEDRFFYHHFGMNPISLMRAFWTTYVLHHRRMGASTLTMQVARLRYQLNSHTVWGKLSQIIEALRLERHYTKSEILTAYFNLAPYGHNIQGVGAASLVYFHRNISDLNLPQLLTLVVLPQNPGIAREKRLHQVRWHLFQQWVEQHPEERVHQSLFHLPVMLASRIQLPFHAPHFVDYVLKHHVPSQRIQTTLDLSLQHHVERTVKRYLLTVKNQGIRNAAVLLADSRDMTVKAWLGSADFFDPKIQGQVNGVLALRSPGSTLKPFIYALALDQGLIHPLTILKDMPTFFGSYAPENFDYRFLGPIRAQDALILSRNIPAIYLAQHLKNPSFYEFLEHFGIVTKSAKEYGLALVIGGAELSMANLVSLYGMLSNLGEYRSLRAWIEPAGEPSIVQRFLSREASFITLTMLAKTSRPNQNFLLPLSSEVAWKTGTSSGFRDAWAVGVIGNYVLAVWIGEFEGKGNPAFSGQHAAAPLFFDLIEALSRQNLILPRTHSPKNLHLTQVKVCAASGLLPTRYCPHTVKTWFIPGKSPIQRDNIYREILIDQQTGLRACKIGPHTHLAIYEFWPSDFLDLFRRAGLARRVPPPYLSGCLVKRTRHTLAPTITSPREAFTYIVPAWQASIDIPLQANTDTDIENLYWFANDELLGKTSPDKPLLWRAKPGKFIVRVVDTLGNVDAVDITVKKVF